MKIIDTTLTINQPFSLEATVLSHGWHECAPMSWSAGGKSFQLIDRIKGKACRVSVSQSKRTKARVELLVTIEAPTINEKAIDRIKTDLRFILGLDRDLSEFYAICEKHPTLHVLPRIGAGRTIRSASMTENIIKALCSTNVSWTQAVKMINRISQIGPPVRHFVYLNAWPTPREILRAGETYLSDVCRLGYRVGSILAFCEDVCSKNIDPDQLVNLAQDERVTSDDLIERLRAIHGIGPSSAHYLLGFLGRHDHLSIDSATIAHVARTHTKGKKPTLAKIEKIYASFGRWKNLVWWFELWLNWGTAQRILHETGVTVPNKKH